MSENIQTKVEFEGEEQTIEGESVEELSDNLRNFAEEKGLSRFLARDEEGEKVTENNIGDAQKIKLLRTEVAG